MLLLAFTVQLCLSQEIFPEKSQLNRLPKNTAGLTWQVLNINNLWTWHRSDGEGNHSPEGEDGLSFPVFSGRCIYEDNLVLGGIMYLNGFPENGGVRSAYQPVRVNGGTYLSNHGMQQGWVDGWGNSAVPHDPSEPRFRIYRIRRDYDEMSENDLRQDAAIYFEQPLLSSVTFQMMDEVKAQYAANWREWPVDHGAPYIERNGIPGYQAPPNFSATFTPDSLVSGGYDEPGVAGDDASSPADQVLYTVYNGLNRSKSLIFAGSEPIGMEIQKTVFGYDETSGLDNVCVLRYRLINKGGVDLGNGAKGTFYLDSLFVGLWADPDLGYAGDDLLACDSTRSLGYAYNGFQFDARYQTFGLPPPALGYDILGGPLITPGDSGIFDFKKIFGRKNQPMTSFIGHGSGDSYSDPPFESYDDGTWGWWMYLQGVATNGSFSDSSFEYFPQPPGYPLSRFRFWGDPVTGEGFVDGLGTDYSMPPGDRIMMGNTGPFRMAPGDTQEIYVGVVCGMGSDRLSSVAVMRANDNLLQAVFDSGFRLGKPPKQPQVRVTELDGMIVLDWGADPAVVWETEKPAALPVNYEFEGYNLYQLPSEGVALEDGIRIATYDKVNTTRTITAYRYDPVNKQFRHILLQRSTDSGLRRYFCLTRSYLNDDSQLNNGTEYYFALTAYNYSARSSSAPSYESVPVFIKAKPGFPFGVVAPTSFGDTLAVAHTGPGGGSVVPIVIDPTAGTGDTYEVRCNPPAWSLFDVTSDTVVLENQSNQTGDDDYLIVAGVLVKVIDDPAQPNSSSDVFAFTVPGTTENKTAIKASVRRISVFPNPFVAERVREPNMSTVTFTNLPPTALIRIYNLAGQLVRTLRKDDPSQFFEWDLANEHNWQVGSGIYLCHIEMPEIGETRILKLAIIQQRLPGW